MSSSFARDALRALRVVPRAAGDRLESRPGAGVHPVTTADGRCLTPTLRAAPNRPVG